MAEQRAPTREEIEADRNKRIKSLEANLKNPFYQRVIGSNDLRAQKNQYGEIGGSIGEGQYGSAMTDAEADKLRRELYKGQMEEKERLGIADAPEYTSNYQVVRYTLGTLNESISELPLANLEKMLGEIDKGVKLEIPDALKQYEANRNEAVINATVNQTEVDQSVLDRDSETTIKAYQQKLYTAIRRAAAFKVMNDHKYDDVNADLKKIGDAFKKAKGIVDPAPEQAQAAA